MKKTHSRSLSVGLFLVFFQIYSVCLAQPGTADNTFNPDFGVGSVEYFPQIQFSDGVVVHSLLQPDGKIVIAYNYSGTNGSLKRINTDGTLDQSFTVPTLGSISKIARQSDGKIVVVGSFPKGILRLNADGTTDNSFNPGTGVSASGSPFVTSVIAVAIQPDGKILIGGFFNGYNGSTRVRLARLMSDGTLDVTFNPGDGPNNGVFEIIVQSDNKILIGGGFTAYAGTSRKTLARLNPDGNLDESLTLTGTDGIVQAMALQSDGKIVVGGTFLSYNGVSRSRLTRLNSDGSTDDTFIFGSGANSGVYSMKIDADGKILVGGDFTNFSGTTVGGIVRLTTTGAPDNTFKPYVGPDVANSSSQKVNCILVEADGRILVGGGFKNVNKTTRLGLARLNADGTLEGGRGADNIIYTAVNDSNGKIVIGGTFTGYNGRARNRVARLHTDGTLDLTFDAGTGANNTVHKVGFQNDGKIIVAGDFTTFAGTARNRIARINTDGTFDATFDPGSGANGVIYAMAVQADGKIVIGGNFTQVNGIARNRIARLDANGALDTSFDPGQGMDANVRAIWIMYSNKIIVGGDFTTVNATALPRLTVLNTNGSIDATFVNTGCDAAVTAIAMGDDKIIIGGVFSTCNGISKKGIARVNLNGSIDENFDAGTAIADYVRTLSVQSDGGIVVGGEFAKKVIRLNANGSVNQDFLVDTGANEKVFASLIQSDGKIVIAGQFTSYNGMLRDRIARVIGGSRLTQNVGLVLPSIKKFGDAPFDLIASASSGLSITLTSSNTSVATINGLRVTIVGVGTTEITASQSGSATYQPASAKQTLIVEKADQTITFNALETVDQHEEPITLTATSSSGLPVTYESSNLNVATISGAVLTITGIGTTTVKASQSGNGNYNAATPVERSLEVAVLTSVEDPTYGDALAYPNPATDVVRIRVDNPGAVSIRNNMGSLLEKRVLAASSDEVVLDVSSLPAGAYLITVVEQKKRITKTIIKR